MTPGLVGVDWGTTNRRAYRLDGAGVCVAEHADADGLLDARGRFAQSLDVALAARGVEDPGVQVVMSGMVGSASGWVEAPVQGRLQAGRDDWRRQSHRQRLAD